MSRPERSVGVLAPAEAAKLSGIDFLQGLRDGKYPAPPFSATADIWIDACDVGRVVFTALPSERFYNPLGVVHGGWISTLLDSAMGCAVFSSLDAGMRYTTIELKTVFVRPVVEQTGKLRCEALLLHGGRRVASAEGKVFDTAGRLVAHGSTTCLVMSSNQGAGKWS